VTSHVSVAIVGAGPYGLAIAAHLEALGIEYQIFGPPMAFWRDMPPTLNLKSFAFATSIPVPRRGYSLPEYYRARGLPDLEPCTMESFAEYGLWVQRALVPRLDPALVTNVTQTTNGFEVSLANGETTQAQRVIVAIGLTGFAYLPPSIAGLPAEAVSHTARLRHFSELQGQTVAVIGAGASAIEAATLLHEAGATPHLLVRGPELIFHSRFDPRRSLAERLRSPNSVLGPGRKSWVLEHFPGAIHYVPEARRVRFTQRYLGPAGPWWIADRFHGHVDVHLRTEIARAQFFGGRVHLELRRDGTPDTLIVDRVVAGTGFDVDVDRLPFLDGPLRARVRRVGRAPSLSRHFESSVPGLYFVGAASALSFGPLVRFVAGARYAAPRVARHAARNVS
jgi:cation diffusion facilitator CzcD-associated flavoprotein CzcO